MPADQQRLTLDEGVEFIERTYGLSMSRQALEDICEGGWSPCARASGNDWTVDPAELERSWHRTVRLLGLQTDIDYVEREATEQLLEEPPGGAEAEEDI